MESKIQPIIMNSHSEGLSSTNPNEINPESSSAISYTTMLKNSTVINKGLGIIEKFKMGSLLSDLGSTNKSVKSEDFKEDVNQQQQQSQQQVQQVQQKHPIPISSINSECVDSRAEMQDTSITETSKTHQLAPSLNYENNSNKNKRLFFSNELAKDEKVTRSIIKKQSPSKQLRTTHSSNRMNAMPHSKTVHGYKDIAHVSLEAAPKSSNLPNSNSGYGIKGSPVTMRSKSRERSYTDNTNHYQYDKYHLYGDGNETYGWVNKDPSEYSRANTYGNSADCTSSSAALKANVSTVSVSGMHHQQNKMHSKYWNNNDFNYLSKSCNCILYNSPRQENYWKTVDSDKSNKLLDEIHRMYIQLKERDSQIRERDAFIRYLQSVLYRRDQLIQQLVKQVPDPHIHQEYYDLLNEWERYAKSNPSKCSNPYQSQVVHKGLKQSDKSETLSHSMPRRWNPEKLTLGHNNRNSYLKEDVPPVVDQRETYSGEVTKSNDITIITPIPIITTDSSPPNITTQGRKDMSYNKIQYSKSGSFVSVDSSSDHSVGNASNNSIIDLGKDSDSNKPAGIGVKLQILSTSRVKRHAISGESEKYLPPPTSHLSNWPKIEKPAHTKALITQAILDNDFMKHLDKRQISKIVDSMCPLRCSRLSWIIQEGEVGSVVYVLEDGYVEVQKAGERLREMGPGTVFGELAILYNCTRTASVRAITDCKLWAIDRPCFQSIMMFTGIQKQTEYVKFLKSVPTFKDLNLEVLGKVAVVLGAEHYEPDEYVIREGERGNTFFIITDGKVKVTKNRGNERGEQFIRYMTRGDWFGEKALTDEDVRTANIIAMPPRGVDCLMLDRDSYNLLIKDLVSFQRSYPDEKPVVNQREKQFSDVKLTDFTVVSTIGIGGFGRVQLVYLNKDKRQCFALKRLKKHYIVETKQQEHVLNEKNILTEANHDFIVKLYRTYRDNRYLYLLLEVCLGGELWTLLRNSTSFDDSTARFYSACVVEALNYLHRKGIVYRDLKPENLLLDSQGFCKMTDFGFAKRIGYGNKTWTFCGTPEYVAPEVILNKGHDFAVDFWALGILMFELLTGTPPFTSSDPMRTYNIILKGINTIEFPKCITRNAQCLIKKLCRDAPAQRLGARKSGITEVKSHAWFEGFDWDGLVAKTIQVPINPKVGLFFKITNNVSVWS
ncbi:unnamed protein product [Trichobilharzia szidati]|nr:unnamed protein product [Trichobilharzia szidati]